MTDTILTTNAEPVLTTRQFAEVMDTSVRNAVRVIGRFKGAVKTSRGWQVPASTIHGFLQCFKPNQKVEPANTSIPNALVGRWFWIVIELGLPEEIPTLKWITEKQQLVDTLSGCECGKT